MNEFIGGLSVALVFGWFGWLIVDSWILINSTGMKKQIDKIIEDLEVGV